MFGGKPRLVRAAIAQHVQKITLKPAGCRSPSLFCEGCGFFSFLFSIMTQSENIDTRRRAS
jgi:hypothetical protein